MNYHIVRTNEKLESIAKLYNYTINEIKDLNRHITSWNNLIPGTRIKLPAIPDAIVEELNDTEPFIEDYYPKIDVAKYESSGIQKENNDSYDFTTESIDLVNNDKYDNVEENKKDSTIDNENKNSSFKSSIKLPKNYGYYYDAYEYYRYMQRKRNIKRPKN